MNRREVLKAIALTAPLTVGGRLYAAPWTSTRLLVVFLRGAYDAANVVVPVSSEFYYQSRPTLAIAKPNPNDPNAALPLDRDWALHPALKETLYPLYQQQQLAFVPFAGTATPAAATSKHRTRLSWGKRSMGHEISNRDL